MSELTPITRVESYLDAIVNNGIPPTEDITRIETFLQAIYDNQVCALTPITRIEMFLGKISGQDIVLPEPITRIELYLAAIAGEDVELPENPITRLEMYLAEWADSGDWTTISGAIVEFITQRAHKLKSCVVSLSPQQDLHGYDSPWPAGGGKNKVQVTASSATVNGITFTVNSDGTVTANGTATAEAVLILNNTTMNTGAGTFTGSGATGGSGSTYYLQFRVDGLWKNCYASITFEDTETGVTGVLIDIKSGITMNNYVFKPQLEAGSTATAFAPYSNICPISGWTGCEVWDFGKNLFNDADVIVLNNLSLSNGIYSNTRTDTRAFNFVVQALNGSSQVASSSTIIISTAGRYSVTIDIASEPSLLRIKHNGAATDFVIQYPFTLKGKFVISIDVLSADTSTIGGLSFKDVMIELGTTATEYEQFNNDSASYSVTFEEMVIGGEIDFVSGQGKSERNNAVFDGTETFTAYGNLYVCSKTFQTGTGNYMDFLCSHTPVSSYINYANDSKNTFQFTSTYFGVSTVEEFKTFLAEQNANGTPVTINYPLATPTDISITPTPITALKGYNAMWSNGGDIEATVHGTPVEVSTPQALNMLLGGAYRNGGTSDDVSDDEALDIILGGEQR